MNTIIAPLDGSALSEEGLPIARELASALRATLYLVRVVEPTGQSAPATSDLEPALPVTETDAEIEDEQQNEARVYLDRVAGNLRRHGPNVTWEVRIGRPADEIARLAETTAADLIVIATHGLNGARRSSFGSVTQELLHHTTVPVMVVPPGSHRAGNERGSTAGGEGVSESPMTAIAPTKREEVTAMAVAHAPRADREPQVTDGQGTTEEEDDMTTIARLSPHLEELLMRLVYAERSLTSRHEDDDYALHMPGGHVCLIFAGLDHTMVESEAIFEVLVDLGYLEWRSAPKSLRPFEITLHGQAYVDRVEALRHRTLR